METENVYSAVLSLFKTRSWELSWRIVVVSRVQIILEKRDFGVEMIVDSENFEKCGKKRGPGRPRRSAKTDDGVDARSVKRRGPCLPQKNAENDKAFHVACAKRRGPGSELRKTRRRQDVGDSEVPPPTPDEVAAFDYAAPEADALPETGGAPVKADEIKSEYIDVDLGDRGGDFGGDRGGDFGAGGADFGYGGGYCDDDWGGSSKNRNLNPEMDVFALDLDKYRDLNSPDEEDNNDHVTNHDKDDKDDNYEDDDVNYDNVDDDERLEEEQIHDSNNQTFAAIKNDSHPTRDLIANNYSSTSKRIPINSDSIDAAAVPSTPVVDAVVGQFSSLQPVDRSTSASSLSATVSGETSVKGTLPTYRKSRKLGKYQKLALPRGSYSKSKGERDSPRQFVKKPCPVCKKTTYGNKYLRIHIKRCHLDFMSEKEKEEAAAREVAERTCNICSKTLSTKGALGTHMKEIHLRDSLEDRTCNICGKVSWWTKSLILRLTLNEWIFG